MSTELPGANPASGPLPTQAQPGKGKPSPETEAAVARWNMETQIRPALAELIDVLDRHPELMEWARESRRGTVRLSNNPDNPNP